jgi:thiol:disulfide interchange protein DsbD
MKVLLQTIFAAWLALSASGAAKTQMRLVLSAETAQPGETIWAALELKMPSKWHTYWRNGGDSGIPTSITWALPDGIKAGEIQWPLPEKLVEIQGDFTSVVYVYENEAALLIPLEISKTVHLGNLKLNANVSWQECAELCVQGHSDVSANLIIGDHATPSPDALRIEAARKRIPQSQSQAQPRVKVFWENANTAIAERPFIFEWENTSKDADFFPYEEKDFSVGGKTERLNSESGKIRLRKTIQKSKGDWPTQINGVLVSGNPPENGIEVKLPIGSAANSGASGAVANSGSLITVLLFAFLGGLILNIMPCVLPVIALKVLGFVNQAKEHPKRVRSLGIVYGLGVLVSFLVLAIIAISIQRAGGIADWGTAFRNPIFRVLITVLITLVALNLFGLFEVTLSGRAMGAAGELTAKQGYPGAFFNGVLATILATPCTAPFLGVALAFAFTQPPPITIVVFLVVGLGLALPFVIICVNPRLLKFLPKPGVWMEHFKVAMGFPMLATAVWLFWLTATRMGQAGVLWFGIFLVMIAFAAWIWGQFVQRGSRNRILAMTSAFVLILAGYVYILEGKLEWRTASANARQKLEWKPWSAEAVEKARRAGHPVLVDFTADSCLNCQFNKVTSIEVEATRRKLKEIRAETFIADYTDESPIIARELQRYGRPGVPLVLVFPSDVGKPAIVLPPVLTKSIVLRALEEAASTNALTQSASAR